MLLKHLLDKKLMSVPYDGLEGSVSTKKKPVCEIDFFFCYRKNSFAIEKVRLQAWYSVLL